MIGKLADQPPFLVGKLGTQRAPSRRLLALTHGGKLQGEDAAKLVVGFRMGREKGVSAVDQHAPKLEGLRGKTEHPVGALHHRRPHVVERIRQQRQGTHVLDRGLNGAPGNCVHKPSSLEPCREQFGRPAHDLVQLHLAQRRQINLSMHLTRGEIRGGRFVAGFAGEQFALPEAIGALREARRKDDSNTLVSLSGADPLNLAGILTPGPKLAGLTRNRVLYRDGIPIALLEGGEIRFLETLEAGSEWEARKTLLRSSVPPPLTHLS